MSIEKFNIYLPFLFTHTRLLVVAPSLTSAEWRYNQPYLSCGHTLSRSLTLYLLELRKRHSLIKLMFDCISVAAFFERISLISKIFIWKTIKFWVDFGENHESVLIWNNCGVSHIGNYLFAYSSTFKRTKFKFYKKGLCNFNVFFIIFV